MMAMKWMMGTAAIALLAATPAFAQSTAGTETCALDGLTNERFVELDSDSDGRLTLDEYRQCLDQAGLGEDERSEHERMFEIADADRDQAVMYVDIERIALTQGTTQQASADEVGEPGRPQGTITVTQPGANVAVTQASPEVTVSQPDPVVNVETSEPEVAVTTPEPEVEVTQSEPTVAVSQAQPEVSVTQPEPEVSIEQPNPEVAVEAGQPAITVDTQEPEVAVQTPAPEVEVEQPELDVAVEQGQPDVVVEQGQPEVAVRQSTSADVQTETASVDADEMTDAATADAAAAPAYRISMDDMIGATVQNADGDEIGEVQDVVLDPNGNSPAVIVRVGGGLFGIGARSVAFPYDDLTISGDRIILGTAMTEDELSDMPAYDEATYQPLPDTMMDR